MQHVISFSLYGSRPLYCHGAVRNAELAATIFPGWRCRFYVGEDVPPAVVTRLATFPHVDIVQAPTTVGGMFWRFLPAFEANTIAIFRDTDSRLSQRDRRCVNEWLASGKTLSTIRDHLRGHYCHAYPILGGLWGIRGPLTERLRREMETRLSDERNADQKFLAECIWPLFRHDCSLHGIRETPWMSQTHSLHFCGQAYDECERPLYQSDSTERISYPAIDPNRLRHLGRNVFFAPRSACDGDVYGTHSAWLAAAIAQTQGPILECGMGHFSTRLIASSGRRAVGYEHDRVWLDEMTRCYARPGYAMRPCPLSDQGTIDWNRVDFREHDRWGVALIDQHPSAGRLVAISALGDICDFLVVHDTECPTFYYEPLLQGFRYRYDDDHIPQTTIVSNMREFHPPLPEQISGDAGLR